MGSRTIFSLLLIWHISPVAFGQDISQHLWRDRLVLVLTSNEDNATYKQQIEMLASNPAALQERDILIYLITPTTYKRDLAKTGLWITGNALYKKYKRPDSDFEVILIGLDGGVKLRDRKLVSTETLFALIDGMPMRKAELRRQGEK